MKKKRTSDRRCVPFCEIENLRLSYAFGGNINLLADYYGVSSRTIRRICKGETHSSFGGPIATKDQRKDRSRGLRSTDQVAHNRTYDTLEAKIRKAARSPNPVEAVFDLIRTSSFPYRRKLYATLPTILERLCNSVVTLENNHIPFRSVGEKAVSSYHPWIEHVRFRKRASPYDVFQNDTRLRKVLQKLISSSKKTSLASIRRGLETASHVVANFRPNAAMTIYSRYHATSVLDPCMGWGGRLFGALAYGIPYVGIDPNPYAIAGNKEFLGAMEATTGSSYAVEIIKGRAEKLLLEREFNVDLVFTSPPYFDTEDYLNDKNQSHRRYPNFDSWCENFLKQLIVGSARRLIAGGHLALVVNKEMGAIVVDYGTNSGLQFVERLHYDSPRNTYGNGEQKTSGSDPILVFRKVV